MAVEVDIKGDDTFAERLAKKFALIDLTKFADAISPIVLAALRTQAPKVTGVMAAELSSKRTSGADATSVFTKIEFRGPKHPLDWVLHGTFPHVIKPKESSRVIKGAQTIEFREGKKVHKKPKHVLAFDWHGERVYFFRVNHPGIVHPSNFPERAWRSVQPEVGRLFKATFGG